MRLAQAVEDFVKAKHPEIFDCEDCDGKPECLNINLERAKAGIQECEKVLDKVSGMITVLETAEIIGVIPEKE